MCSEYNWRSTDQKYDFSCSALVDWNPVVENMIKVAESGRHWSAKDEC
jgi:hypothetical protein